jgi:hypothetical protein
MLTERKTKIYLIISLVCAIWFLLTGSVWVYFANLVISYPVGLLSFVLWNKCRKAPFYHTLQKAVMYLLLAGSVISLISLLILVMFN